MNNPPGAALRLSSPTDGDGWVDITVNGETIHARQGESLAAALLAAGYRTLRHTFRGRAPRGIYCGMGVCHECLVTINRERDVRACLTSVEPNLRVEIDIT